jgi:hypothetical protein
MMEVVHISETSAYSRRVYGVIPPHGCHLHKLEVFENSVIRKRETVSEKCRNQETAQNGRWITCTGNLVLSGL